MESSILQTLIAAVGLGTQLVLLFNELFKFLKESGADSGSRDNVRARNGNAIALRTKSFLDLSFIVLCSAFFALLTADSLIVSGRTPSGGPLNVFYVVVIALAYTSIVFIAWYLNITEKVIGFLAIITLVILITSPGGPFDTSHSEGESGLSVFLILPVVILVTLASTMLIYSYGNPFKRDQPAVVRTVIGSGLLISCIIAAVSTGKQIDRSIAEDERSPQFEGSGKDFAKGISDARREVKRNFYHLASEISLTGHYQDQYFNMLQQRVELDKNGSDVTVDPKAAGPIQKDPKADQTAPSGPISLRTSGSNSRIATNSSVASKPTRTPSSVAGRQAALGSTDVQAQLSDIESQLQMARNEYADYPTSTSQQRVKILERERDDLKRQTTVSPWIDFLVTKFENLSPAEKTAFLVLRLYWIHPVGWDTNNESVIPTPGLTADDRLKQLAKYRLVFILSDQERQRRRLLNSVELSYPDEVRDYYPETRNRDSEGQTSYLGSDSNYQSRKQRVSEFNQRRLFPPDDFIKISLPAKSTLKAQLSLPEAEESIVAYREYQLFSCQQIRSFDAIKQVVAAEKMDAWLTAIDSLDYRSRQAMYFSLVKMARDQQISVPQVLSLITDIKSANIDFGPFIESGAPLKIQKLSQQLSTASKPDELFPELMNGLRQLRAEDRSTLNNLLANSDNAEVSIEYLFDAKVLKVLSDIGHDLNSDAQTEFVSAVVDPVWYSTKSLPFKESGQEAFTNNTDEGDLATFHSLSFKNQNAVLEQLATSFYQPGGQFSFDPISLLIAQAHLINERLGWITASALCLPFVIGFMALGVYLSNLLNKRDRMRDVLTNESRELREAKNTLGSPVDLVGRKNTLRTLCNLAERGWSTIGIVGRRGIGKSRILHALVSTTETTDTSIPKPTRSPGIRLWISSPSKFTEEEFIRSIYERLALSTENAIAKFLHVKPLSARTIENRIAIASTWIYSAAVLLFGIVIYYMSTRLSRIDIVVIWIPIIGLLFTSIFLFVSYLTKLQPVNLTAWLQRTREHNPQTYLLYRDVYRVLEAIRLHASDGKGEESLKGFLGLGRAVVLGFLCVIVAAGAIFVTFAVSSPNGGIILAFAVTFFVVALAAWLFFYRKAERTLELTKPGGTSLMSLIAEYRIFASNVVYRLQQGALDAELDQKFTVVVCIDELDKIVDFEEIRSFIRRVKAIFEVPGLYYYISIAEDTLRALYLGPVAGKNEVDSAFDHIVRIPPLTLTESEQVAHAYLGKNLPETAGLMNASMVIAAISFGLPRDIIRRCDEFISDFKTQIEASTDGPLATVRKYRHRQIDLGYELQQLTTHEANKMRTSSAVGCALAVKEALSPGETGDGSPRSQNESRVRFLLLVWTLAMIEAYAERKDFTSGSLQTLSELGYRITDAPLSDLLDEADGLYLQLLSQKSPEETTA